MGGSRGFFFFFQAEDGIRDGHVTGVQTCALPISLSILVSSALATAQTVMEGAVQDLSGNPIHDAKVVLQHTNRSEERRVGKECRSRWWTQQERKKQVHDVHTDNPARR